MKNNHYLKAGLFVGLSLFSYYSFSSTSGYICNVAYFPVNPSMSYGRYGYFQAVLEESPNCKGITVGFYNFCSSGATSTNCASDIQYHYGSSYLRMLFSDVRSQMISGKRVVVSDDAACQFDNCGQTIRFWAN